MQRLRERQRVSPAPERIAYLRDRAVELAAESAVVMAGVAVEAADEAALAASEASDDAADALLAVDGLVDGSTPFEVLNVAGAILADADGLADGVVTTDVIAPDAVSTFGSARTDGTISYSGSGYDTAQTVAATLTGRRVEVKYEITFSGNGSSQLTAELAVERTDGVTTVPVWGPFIVAHSAVSNVGTGAHDILELVTATVPDEPPAGVWTYALKFILNGSGAAARNVRGRYLGLREMRTEA